LVVVIGLLAAVYWYGEMRIEENKFKHESERSRQLTKDLTGR
jgi:hypothetical protein